MMDEKIQKRYGDLLEVLMVLAFIFLVISIYVPVEIWKEEDYYANKSRFYMENVYQIEQFYKELLGDYNVDGSTAVQVVDAVRDSLMADSTFLDEQTLYLKSKSFTVNVPEGFDAEFDTTFGFRKTRRDTIQDTTVTLLLYDVSINRIDTVYIQKRELKKYQNDPNLREIVAETPMERVEAVTYYDTYMPDTNMLYCPLTGKPFDLNLSEDGSFRIASPIVDEYRERRYGIFSFKASNHGYIEDGVKSWDKR
ncbi:MAG: hypothetical protein GXO90_06390 [FCB group bacterium]|nr:hypothetical protein [FCB group bacterium]